MMEQKSLSGIERTLVVQYLTDGNVPVTLTPVEETLNSDEVIHSLTSQIFPVAIKGEQVQVSHKGEIVIFGLIGVGTVQVVFLHVGYCVVLPHYDRDFDGSTILSAFVLY